jgi:hypothetical protein
MSIKIYQAYYREDQIPNLDPEFTPYDNTANPVKNLYELYIYHQVRQLAQAGGVDLWGVFSWQWKNKMPGVTAPEVIRVAEQGVAAGATAIIFNAFPFDEVLAYNVWEQGEWCHPGICHLAHQLLTAMGENPDLVYEPMDNRTYLTANYFIGNSEFWDGLLEFLDRFKAAIPLLSEEDQKKLFSSAGYGPNPNLDYTGFICERMISTYLAKELDNFNGRLFNVLPDWPLEQYKDDPMVQLIHLKRYAVQNRDADAMHDWNAVRPLPDHAKNQRIATEWINKIF